MGTSFLFLFFLSCTNDAYDTGDTRYSYLRTDFVEAATDGNVRLVSATTDDGVGLTFSKTLAASWATVADTTYRAMLYYTLSPSSTYPSQATSSSASTVSPITVEPVAAAQVYVLVPKAAGDGATTDSANHNSQFSILNSQPETDPVYVQSKWVSGSGRYINLGLALMTGVPDSVDARQTLGLVLDSVVTTGGHRHCHLTLTHSQGGVPQYYKATVYASIPVAGMKTGDTVVLTVNTYDGRRELSFAF